MDKQKNSKNSCFTAVSTVVLILIFTGIIYCTYIFNYATHPVGISLITNTCKANNNHEIHKNITDRNHSYIVPNIIHYLWFTNFTGVKGKHAFNFVNYVSIKSVCEIQKPEKILFHCDVIPSDIWWQKAWRDFPLNVVFHSSRSDIFGVKAKHIEHISDIIRLEILLEQGGIYLDCDVIIVKSLDPLRHYPATMGKEDRYLMLNAGTILASPNSTFIQLWYNAYKTNFRPGQWVYNSGAVPYNISLEHPDLIHTELRTFSAPPGIKIHRMIHGYVDYSYFYTFHLTWYDKDYNENNIKKPHTTAAEILRWIYYGTKKPVT